MHAIRVYVDTSVWGGIEDVEFSETSQAFFEQVRVGRYRVLISSITYAELDGAPAGVRQLLDDLPQEMIEEVRVDEEVEQLAEAYVKAGALPRSAGHDAIHVAAASVAAADLILSWNFRHIVNYDRIRRFNAANLLRGYKALDIRSPLEMGHADEDQDI